VKLFVEATYTEERAADQRHLTLLRVAFNADARQYKDFVDLYFPE
jgi:hypothetical protein